MDNQSTVSKQPISEGNTFTTLSRLTVFLSWIGIHRFYVGKHATGTLFILIFFSRWTLEGLSSAPDHPYRTISMVLSFASMIWQFYDLFQVAFGQFRDAEGKPIKLSIYASIPSQVQYGPLLIWACFAGILGAHQFYAKNYKKGFLQLCTLGGLGIWAIYDVILLTRGDFTDAQGYRVAHIYNKNPHIDVVA